MTSSDRLPVLRAIGLADLASDPDERDAWLRFAVVGGGATGVALATQLAAFIDERLGPRAATISLVEGGPRILPRRSQARARRAARRLAERGVHIWQRALVVGADEEGLDIRAPGGVPVRLPARTVLWALKDLSSTPRTTEGVTI
jgi:NADH:ubiquinone reductase (H+-translocating)